MNKKLMLAIAISSLAIAGCGEKAEAPAAPAADDSAALETLDQRISYLIGMNVGSNLKRDAIELDIDALNLALKDAMEGREPRLSEAELQGTMQAFQERLQAQRTEELSAVGAANQAAGEEYLTANAQKEGVQTTESGLQYKVIESGDGATPGPEEVVRVHYEGSLIDGTVFDSSIRRGEPINFPVNRVIPGWTEALQLMKVGDKWELTIPSDLAYGPGGMPPDIGPNSTLLFKVELLDIVPEE